MTMPVFAFDENRTPQENIELFCEHMRSIDPELAVILVNGMTEILPLPEAGPDRNLKRSQANSIIQRALDALSLR
jgi:hypothetical protein